NRPRCGKLSHFGCTQTYVGIAKGSWALGWRNAYLKAKRPKGPSCEEPFGRKRVPTKREPEMSFGSTRVSVSSYAADSFGLIGWPLTLLPARWGPWPCLSQPRIF